MGWRNSCIFSLKIQRSWTIRVCVLPWCRALLWMMSMERDQWTQFLVDGGNTLYKPPCVTECYHGYRMCSGNIIFPVSFGIRSSEGDNALLPCEVANIVIQLRNKIQLPGKYKYSWKCYDQHRPRISLKKDDKSWSLPLHDIYPVTGEKMECLELICK